MNIPDGEVYTAPVRESMNGTISYSTPSEEQGFTYENIVFKIKDGKIVKAMSNNNERINQLLDTDDGSKVFRRIRPRCEPVYTPPDERHAFR